MGLRQHSLVECHGLAILMLVVLCHVLSDMESFSSVTATSCDCLLFTSVLQPNLLYKHAVLHVELYFSQCASLRANLQALIGRADCQLFASGFRS